MHKFFKKMACVLTAIVLLVSIPFEVSASGLENVNDHFEEYASFSYGKERINADGTFDFSIRSGTRSQQNFTVKKSSVTVSVKCWMYNVNTGRKTTDNSQELTFTLYDGATKAEIGSFTITADNESHDEIFTLETEHEYYFTVTCDPTLTVPYTLKGTGKISNLDEVIELH